MKKKIIPHSRPVRFQSRQALNCAYCILCITVRYQAHAVVPSIAFTKQWEFILFPNVQP